MWFFRRGNPCGMYSWQHFLVITVALSLMFFLAIFLGLKLKNSNKKTLPLKIAAIAILSGEIFKWIIVAVTIDAYNLLFELPLFLCSVSLIALPLAAFMNNKLGQYMKDFVFIFGLLGALAGTFLSVEFMYNYAFSFFPLVSVFTHCLSGFASLYIGISKQFTMDKKSLVVNLLTLITFMTLAIVVNTVTKVTNYMFMASPEGTPFEIIYNLFNGNLFMYIASIVTLQLTYILLFFLFCKLMKKNINKKKRYIKLN